MNLFNTATEDVNAATESKCENYFPLEKLSDILDKTKGNYIIRKEIFFFFYNCYLQKELVIFFFINPVLNYIICDR